MTKLTEQEIAEGWQLNTGEQPVPNGVKVDYNPRRYTGFCKAEKLNWELNYIIPIVKWRINPDYKAQLEEQARAVFPELDWPEKVDPMEVKVLEILDKYKHFVNPYAARALVLDALKAGMEMAPTALRKNHEPIAD